MITKGQEAPLYSVKSHGNILNMQVKDVDLHKRKVKWIGNTYNFLDSDNDVLMPGCAKNSIKMMGPNSDSAAKIKHALFHDMTLLPGKIVELSEADEYITGISQKCKCLMGVTEMSNTQLGDDTLVNYQEGIYDNHSIGFKYMKYSWAQRDSADKDMKERYEQLMDSIINPKDAGQAEMILQVHEIKLYEISTVAFGANSLTPYLGSKSMQPEVVSMLLNRRMKTLMQSIKKGTQSDDMLYNIQVQFDQLMQMSNELFSDVAVKNLMLEKYKALPPQETKETKAAAYDFKEKLDEFSL